jgi:multidrug efflux pump subunit AcrA (membrane-fusion protein)
MRIIDRLGFRFTESPADYEFRLGPRAAFGLWFVFIVNALALIAGITVGLRTPVTVKAPLIGQMEPRQLHRIFPEAEGVLAELRVRRGDRLAAGDTLGILAVANPPARLAVRSPGPGTVLAITAAEGEPVSPAVAIFEVADLEHLVLVAWVPEFHRRRILVGQEAVIRFPVYRRTHFRGAVLRVSPAAQVIQGRSMYEVRLDVTPPETAGDPQSGADFPLMPGMSATGDVLVDRMPALRYLVAVRMLHRY